MRHGEVPIAAFARARRISLAGLLLAMVSYPVAGAVLADAPASLDVSLSPVPGGDVRFSVTNEGGAPVALLLRDTPLDRFVAHEAFEVLAPARDWPGTRRLAWTGPVAKRLPPGADEVRTLGPGETASAIVPVAATYAVPERGTYTVRWAGTLRTAPDGVRAQGDLDGFDAVRPEPASAQLVLEASAAPLEGRLRSAGYESCSVERRALIEEAAGIAEAWSVASRDGLEGLAADERPDSPRYRLWFGQHDANRFDAVLGAFRAIAGALTDRSLAYDCDCDEPGVFAYVNPYIAYDITLCPVFWATTAAGRDSRAGTIIHEVSHFRTVASTVDHVYAQIPSQRLAVERPDLAIENADSYGYFAENLPAIDIGPDGARPANDPPGGSVGAGFATLAPGGVVEAELGQGARARYRIDGAASVTLESLSGDADLAVFADAALTRRTCLSELIEPIDACALPDDGPAWVEVLGYTAARYRLVVGPAADPSAVPSADAGEGISLLGTIGVGDAVSGEVERGAVVAWELVDGGLVELRSDVGDVDLYVHSIPPEGQPLGDATLVCRSFGDSAAGDVVERCHADAGAPRYVLVAGFRASAYTLSVGAAAEAATRPGNESGIAIVDDLAVGAGVGQGGSPGGGSVSGRTGGGAGAAGRDWLLLLPATLRLRLRRRRWRSGRADVDVRRSGSYNPRLGTGP